MSIQHFIDQLCQDIRDAKNFVFPEEDYSSPLTQNSFHDGDDFVPPWLIDEPEYPIHELFEISPEFFPPSAFLSKEHMQQVLDAIQELWESQRLWTWLPEDAPLSLRYEAIRKLWSEETSPFPCKDCFTKTHLEICPHDMDSCFWGERYCLCKSIIPEFDEFGNRVDDDFY
jgi:hypothetical protein